MKAIKNILLSVLVLFALTATAQSSKNFDKAQDDNWLVDVDEAYEISKKTNKPIMANFTGSDWCGWCMKLRKEVFNTAEFKKWAEENVVLLELDYPKKKKLPAQQAQQNAGLQKAFQVNGFPTIWVFDLNKTGKDQPKFQLQAYGKTGYLRGGSANYTKELDKMIARKAGG